MDELKKLAEEINSKNDEIVKSIESKAKAEEVETLKSELSTLKSELEEKQTAMQKQADDNNILIEKMRKEIEVKSEPEDRMGSLAVELKKNKEGIEIAKRDRKPFIMNVKTVGDMTLSGNVTGQIPQAMRAPGLNLVATRPTFVADYIQRAAISSNTLEVEYQSGKEGSAAGTTEAATKNQIDFDLKLQTESLVKFTAYTRVSDEMLMDIPYMMSEIQNYIFTELDLLIDAQLLTGSGSGNNLNGLITRATSFAAGNNANTVSTPNNWDVLRAAIVQIQNNYFQPNAIFINTDDLYQMISTKDTTDQYVQQVLNSAIGLNVMGVPVVANPGVTYGTFLVLDGSKATQYIKNDIEIEIGLNGDDFKQNMRTIRGETRRLLNVKYNNTGALVTGSFSTAKTALDSDS